MQRCHGGFEETGWFFEDVFVLWLIPFSKLASNSILFSENSEPYRND